MAIDFSKYGKVNDLGATSTIDFSRYGTPSSVVLSETPTKESGATFQSSPDDSPIEAGLKSLGNLPQSAVNLGRGLFSAVANPIDTLKGIGSVAVGGVQKLIPEEQDQEQAFNAFTGILKERYGSLENLQKTATEDPFGFGTDVLGLVTGGAALAGRANTVARTIPKVSQVVTRPVSKAASTATGSVAKTARYGVSQATGLNPETITELVRNPQKFRDISPEIRTETASVVKDALDERLSELSELGKGYETIRNSNAIVQIPDYSVQNILDKYKIKFVDGQIKTTAESVPLSSVDKAELSDFLSTFGNEPIMTGNAVLNARSILSNMSKFDKAKTGNLQKIARDFRGLYDNVAKQSLPDLAKLDRQYAPEVELLNQLKKDIFTPKGELKDAAVSKIANITGKGKEQVLERVKQIVPDIEERVRLIKVVEDIERAQGIKVGTYTRSLIGGAGVFTGNIPAIIGAIISQPQIAVPLLKGAGYVGQKAAPILNAVKAIANDVNNFTLPAPLLNSEGQLKMGLSLEDVSKGNPLLAEARKYKSAEEFKANLTSKQLREVLNETETAGKVASARATGATKRGAGDYLYNQDRGAFDALLNDIKTGNNINDPIQSQLTDIWERANKKR